jgi:hypothetical protein
MKMKILLLIGIGASIFLAIGFASAQLDQNSRTDTSTVEEAGNEHCDGTGECDGSCNNIEQRNGNRGYGPGNGMGNKGCGPRDGTGYGSKNCHK